LLTLNHIPIGIGKLAGYNQYNINYPPNPPYYSQRKNRNKQFQNTSPSLTHVKPVNAKNAEKYRQQKQYCPVSLSHKTPIADPALEPLPQAQQKFQDLALQALENWGYEYFATFTSLFDFKYSNFHPICQIKKHFHVIH